MSLTAFQLILSLYYNFTKLHLLNAFVHFFNFFETGESSTLHKRCNDLELLSSKRLQRIKVLEAQLKQYIAASRGSSGLIASGVGGESEIGSELALVPGMSFEPGENLLEVFVVSGTFVGQGPDGASALPTSSIMFNGQAVTLNDDSTTFVMCDFYDYETQTTPLLLGLQPQYNFSATYKVETDHFFLRFLSTDSLVLEINLARNADFQLVAQCTLPLRDLLETSGEKTIKEAPMLSVRLKIEKRRSGTRMEHCNYHYSDFY